MFSNYGDVVCVAFKVVSRNLELLTAVPFKSLTTYKIMSGDRVVGTVVIQEGWRVAGDHHNIHAICSVLVEGCPTQRVVHMPSDYFRFYEELGLQLLVNLS